MTRGSWVLVAGLAVQGCGGSEDRSTGEPLLRCAEGEYVVTLATASENVVCAPISACAPWEIEAEPPTTTQDRRCACPFGISRDHDGDPDTRCQPLTRISAGSEYSCAVEREGTVQCWGDNQQGRANPPADLVQVAEVATTSGATTCALLRSGTVRCWGSVAGYEPLEELEGVVQISGGVSQFCALLMSGALACVGPRAIVQPTRDDWIQISVGGLSDGARRCGVRADGGVECWGTGPLRNVVPSSLGPALEVSVGHGHVCALLVDGAIRCWGDSEENEAIWVPGDLPPALGVKTGSRWTCAQLEDERLRCWGADAPEPNVDRVVQFSIGSGLCAVDRDGRPYCVGGPEIPVDPGHVVQVAIAPHEGSYGAYIHACALNDVGRISCWGSGATEVPPDLPPAMQVEVAGGSTCALLQGGTVRCWGSRRHIDGLENVSHISMAWVSCAAQRGTVQCGFGGNPVTLGPSGLGDVVQVDTTWGEPCAVDSDGDVFCWGGVDMDVPPLAAPATQVSTLFSQRACARLDDGTVSCWGEPDDFATGLRDVAEIDLGHYGLHCARHGDGTLSCWSDTESLAVPPGLDQVVDVAVGGTEACAATAEGRVQCWSLQGGRVGWKAGGQLLAPDEVLLAPWP